MSFSVLKRVLTQHRIRIETLSNLLNIVAIVPRLDPGLTPRYYAVLKMFEEETDLVSGALLIGLSQMRKPKPHFIQVVKIAAEMNRCRFKCTTDPFEIKALTVPASLLCTLSLRPSLESKGTVASTFIRADHDAVCLSR